MRAATRAGSCATRSDQPRQIRKEATVRQPSRVPQGHLAGAGGIGFAWAKGDDEGCTALQGGGGAAPARRGARWRRKWESRSTLSGTAPWTNYPSGPSGGTSVRIQKRERRWEISRRLSRLAAICPTWYQGTSYDTIPQHTYGHNQRLCLEVTPPFPPAGLPRTCTMLESFHGRILGHVQRYRGLEDPHR